MSAQPSKTTTPTKPSRASSSQQAKPKEEKLTTPPAATSVYKVIWTSGEHELARPTKELGWSGVAAGLSMGLSFVAEAVLHARLPEAPWRMLLTKFGYSVGFLIVILGRQQLFTENTLTPILPLLKELSWSKLGQVARLWLIILLANVAGAAGVAALIGLEAPFDPQVQQSFAEIATHFLDKAPSQHFLGGIFAGWLIATLVWLMPFASSARVLVIILITYLIGLGGFSHIIAGTVEAFYALYAGIIGAPDFFLGFFLPTLCGNAIGGVALVAAINHGQASD